MKKFLVIGLCLGLVYGAEAQHGHSVIVGSHSYGYAASPRISVGFGYYPFYSPFGFYGTPYGYYPYANAYGRPGKLEMKKEDIRSDYADRIYSVKQDSSLTPKQKRQEIRSLKKERDQAINHLITNYHHQPVTQ
jgi:hypothetical protein